MSEQNLKEKYPATFSRLDKKQLAEVAELADSKTYRDGEVLFKAGELEFKFHVIKSGEIEIYDRSGSEPRLMLTHEAGEFTGDVANLSGSPANADAIAKGTTDVYEICAPELRRIIGERPNLSDVILKTFIARWQILNEIDFTGLRVIGSQYSHDTFRIRDFLSKNHVLYTWVNLETDAQIDELLKQFHIKASDDDKGFVKTGAAAATSPLWNSRRQPFLLETSRAGVFAAGDVRLSSVKRVASAVGEGSMTVQFVHEYLKEV